MSSRPIRVGRVRQLDAQYLDEELLELLASQARSALSWFQPRVMESFTPELKAVLSGMVMCSSVLQDKPSPGQQVQDLRWANNSKLPSSQDILDYHARQQTPADGAVSGSSSTIREQRAETIRKDAPKVSHSQPQDPKTTETNLPEARPWLTRRQSCLYTLAYVALKWAWDRLQRHVEENHWREHSENVWKQFALLVIDLVNKVFKVACLLNSLRFLADGRFPSVLSRMTNMRMMPSSPFPFYPSPAYDIMNRQLLWDSFLDLLSTLHTHVDWYAVRRMLYLIFKRVKQGIGKLASLTGVSAAASVANSNHLGSTGYYSSTAIRNAMLDSVPTICVECGKNPASMPLLCIPCAHPLCYFCLHTAVIEEPDYECPECGTIVERAVQQ
eukprot:gb/GECG01013625.1/.p1 GENE.gb/GECG01013625.1/~~gb/GECG01013625.1/.p1  ORF type:complete len:386 (+),score=30.80 gb/GECG01013625.1/:1-1158(+)